MGPNNKKFSESYLEQNGIDAEEVKKEYLDERETGRYDIYNGGNNGNVTIESKDGRDVIDTGMSKDEFFETYGEKKEYD